MSSINFTWSADGSIDSYKVYRSTSPMNVASLPTPLATGVATKSYNDTAVTTGNPYYYRVSSLKNGIEKVSSEIVFHLETDPNYAKLVCALMMDTVTVTDKTSKSTFANNGRAILDTTNALASKSTLKFSTASHFFDVYSDFNFGTGDFCIRCWVRLDSYPGGGDNDMSIVDLQNGFFLYCHNTTGELRMWDGTASVGLNGGTAGRLPLNTWCFVEASRTAGVFRLFLDGKSLGSANYTRNLNSVGFIRVAGSTYNSATRAMRGNIARFSVYKGWGGHTASYTRPNEPEYLHYI